MGEWVKWRAWLPLRGSSACSRRATSFALCSPVLLFCGGRWDNGDVLAAGDASPSGAVRLFFCLLSAF